MISAGGYVGDTARAAILAGKANAVAFGRLFIANPDLPKRLCIGAPLNLYHRATFYGGTEVGYTDYPFLEAVDEAAAICVTMQTEALLASFPGHFNFYAARTRSRTREERTGSSLR